MAIQRIHLQEQQFYYITNSHDRSKELKLGQIAHSIVHMRTHLIAKKVLRGRKHYEFRLEDVVGQSNIILLV